MSRVLITGSAQGLGLLAGRQLIAADHEVVLHARNPTRARAASAAAPGASGVVVGRDELAAGEQAEPLGGAGDQHAGHRGSPLGRVVGVTVVTAGGTPP